MRESESSPGQRSISLRYEGRVYHYRIQLGLEDNQVSLLPTNRPNLPSTSLKVLCSVLRDCGVPVPHPGRAGPPPLGPLGRAHHPTPLPRPQARQAGAVRPQPGDGRVGDGQVGRAGDDDRSLVPAMLMPSPGPLGGAAPAHASAPRCGRTDFYSRVEWFENPVDCGQPRLEY